MALDYTTVYPGQIDPGDPTGYPYGEARDITVPGDGTGWPLQRQWINDLLGWEQALLVAAGLTPTGTPDKVGASQYLDAIEEIINSHEFTDGLHVSAGAAVFDQGALITAGGLTVVNGLIVSSDGAFITGDSSITGALAVSGALSVNGNTTLGNATTDTTTVSGGLIARELSVTTDAAITGTLAIGTDLAVSGEAAFLDTFTATGPATFTDTALFSGATTFSNTVTFSSGIAMEGALVGGVIALIGDAHIRGRYLAYPDSDQNLGAENYDFIRASALTSNRTLTLNHTGAGAGDRIWVSNWDTAQTLDVDDATAGNLAILKTAVGFQQAGMFVYTGTQWQLFMSINS